VEVLTFNLLFAISRALSTSPPINYFYCQPPTARNSGHESAGAGEPNCGGLDATNHQVVWKEELAGAGPLSEDEESGGRDFRACHSRARRVANWGPARK
jgi:hypothetical protein